MGKIYNCVRMKCKTLYQQIHALFSMGSELEDAVTSDINNFEQRLDDYADVNMQNSQDIQDLYESDSKIRITANKNKEDIDILKPKVAKNTEDIASIKDEIGSIDLPGTIYNKINQNKLAIDEINSSDVMQSGINKAKVDQIDTNTADIVLNTADIVLNKHEIAKINNSDVMKSGINATKVTQIETNKNNIDTINTNIQGINTEIDGIKTSDVMTSGINTIKVNQIETNKNAIATANENITQNTNDISDIQTSDVMVSGIDATKVGQIETNRLAIATANDNIENNTTAINIINNSDVMKSGINATKVSQIETNKNAIATANDNIGNNTTAITTINNSDVMKSGINSTKVTQIESNKTKIAEVDTTLKTAINSVNITGNAESITHIATKIDGTTEEDALPIASEVKAGILSATSYKAFSDGIAGLRQDVNALQDGSKIYELTGLTINATSSEITTKFVATYGQDKLKAGITAVQYDIGAQWKYTGTSWIIVGNTVPVATNTSIGVVQGSTVDGQIFVETNGQMSLNGYDTIKADINNKQSQLTTAQLEAVNSGINAVKVGQIETNKNVIATANENITQNTNDIADIKTSDVMTSGVNAVKVEQIETNKTAIGTINASDVMKSGINAVKVKQIGDNKTAIDTINASDVMKSGINATKVGQIETNKNAIATANENIGNNTTAINTINDSAVMKSGINATKVGQIETNKNAIATANENIGNNTTAINTINNSAVMKSGINATKVGQIETNRLAIVTANGEIEKNTTAINTINNSAVMKSGVNSTIVQQVGTNKTGITAVNGRVDTLEENVNGIQANVTNLSSSVNTLEGKVNNNTASVNNLTTDINNLNNGKQGKWKLHTNNNFNDIITTNITNYNSSLKKLEINILKNLKFTFYCTHSYTNLDYYPVGITTIEINKGKYCYFTGINSQFNPDYENCIAIYDKYPYNNVSTLSFLGISYANNGQSDLPSGYDGPFIFARVNIHGNDEYVKFLLTSSQGNFRGRILNELNEYSYFTIKEASNNIETAYGYCIYKIEYQN